MKAVVVGGSIAGLSTALALLREGVEVTVLEKASAIVPAGAGLGLDAVTVQLLKEADLGAGFAAISAPITFEEHRLVDYRQPAECRRPQHIYTHNEPGMVSAHWSDLHRLLAEALPAGIVRSSHKVVALREEDGGVTAIAEAKAPDGSIRPVEVQADFLVAADGASSTVRRLLVPGDARRYSGMVAWRGVLLGRQHPALLKSLQQEFRHLGDGVTFEYNTAGGFNIVYGIGNEKVNWLWYRASPEPPLPGSSVTMLPSQADIAELRSCAAATCSPAFASLVQATEQPFINVIHDKDPLDCWVYGRVALLGEAAHPMSPHGGRSTNSSIQDGFALSQCFRWHSTADFLQAYQSQRLDQTSQEALFSRHIGELRQGWWFEPQASFDWPAQSEEVRRLLLNIRRAEPDYKAHATRLLRAAGATLAQHLA